MRRFFLYKVEPVHIIITAILTVLLLGIMDIYTLPTIAKEAGGIAAFDLQTFGYSKDTAVQFLSNLSAEGKALFLNFQLPLDYLFAVVYTFLFLALFIRLNEIGYKLCFLPLILFCLDIIENTLSVVFLKSATVPDTLFHIGSAVTLIKNIFTLVCTVTIIVFLILWFKNRKKYKA